MPAAELACAALLAIPATAWVGAACALALLAIFTAAAVRDLIAGRASGGTCCVGPAVTPGYSCCTPGCTCGRKDAGACHASITPC